MPDITYLTVDSARIILAAGTTDDAAHYAPKDIIWLQYDAEFCYACADLYRDGLNPSTKGHMQQLWPGHAQEMAVKAQEAAYHSAKLARVAMGMPE